jgi:hypothetical protein
LKAQVGGFAFKKVNLAPAIPDLVEFRSLINELHAVAEHPIYQSCKLGGHGFGGNWSS